MKRIIGILSAMLFILLTLGGCGNTAGSAPDAAAGKEGDSLHIVTTIFPEYDWVRNVLGENPAGITTTFLLDAGVDLHSFQPAAEDILKISTCDLFLYVGGESEEWVQDALQEKVNENMIVLNLLDLLGERVKEEELVEGMQEEDHDHEHEEEHEDPSGEDHDHDEEHAEYDEHVWLSLKNAMVLVEEIEKAIAAMDPANEAVYRENAEAYIASLAALDQQYADMVAAAEGKTLLFGDRFPFRYLTEDYGLSYYAAFAGCSAETEASFETVVFLAEKTDALSLPAVLTIEGGDGKIAETIVQATTKKDQKILTLDSMQSTTAHDAEYGASYLSIMENNLRVIQEALGQEN
ncbi:MAG: zinc ABC transporter substrate-binding protein [Lachnospiraceae bacterium]|nr:zinc ABC transporter substrate-binding protein [Lachnospiraceae bacterium]